MAAGDLWLTEHFDTRKQQSDDHGARNRKCGRRHDERIFTRVHEFTNARLMKHGSVNRDDRHKVKQYPADLSWGFSEDVNHLCQVEYESRQSR